MARPMGIPKTGGRKKGTPNKSTESLQAAFDKLDFNLPAQVTELLPQLAIDKRIDILMSLMGFLYPKRKAIEQHIEVEAEAGQHAEMSDEERRIELARLSRVDAKLADDPKVAAAFDTIADHYERGGS